MGSQRIIRTFLLLMVIQLHYVILLAENGGKHSKSNLILLPGKSKHLSDNEYDDNSEDSSDYSSQYLNDFNSHIVELPRKHSKEEYTNSRQLLGPISYRSIVRRPIVSDNEYKINSRQLSAVTKVPARRSPESSDNEYRANLGQLPDRRIQYSDFELAVTKIPTRRPEFSNSEYRIDARQLLDRRTQYLDSDLFETKAPARRSKSLDSKHLDYHQLHRQAKRRNLEILSRLKSKQSDIENTVDLRQSDHEGHHLHPEDAYVNDQVLARKLRVARKSRPSHQTYPDSNVQQPNTRRTFNAGIQYAKSTLDSLALLPQVFIGKPEPKRHYYDEVKTIACPRGTQFIIDHCEPIFYLGNDSGTRIKEIRKSEIYLDEDGDKKK
ncbi:uncharacterized protein [Anoplolepis gracilipes]|uniref:uncharacterized protein n=1 Tax=Anoplolepis gracilipes TaxID=354296 RepID=UPI003BA1EFD4